MRLIDCDFSPNVTVPILDEAILPMDVKRQAKLLKSNKVSGLESLSLGIFKILLEQWFVLLTTLLNTIFYSAAYPLDWIRVKLVTIYKGNKADVRNYRGILKIALQSYMTWWRMV